MRSAEAAPQPGEAVTTNNRLSTFVNVLKGGLRVLYLEGFPPRPEQKYLAVYSLGSWRDIHVETHNLNPAAPGKRPKDLAGLLTCIPWKGPARRTGRSRASHSTWRASQGWRPGQSPR